MIILLTGYVRASDLEFCLDPDDFERSIEISYKTNPGIPVSDLAESLISKGHHVTLVTSSSQLSSTIVLRGPLCKLIVVPRMSGNILRTLTLAIPDILALRRHIVREQFDIIHANWAAEHSLAALLSTKKIVVSFHDNQFHIVSRRISAFNISRVLLQFLVLIASFSREKIFVSKALKAEFPYSLIKRRFRVIENEVNFKGLDSLKLPENSPRPFQYFVMVAGSETYKNRNVLLESLSFLDVCQPIEIRIISVEDEYSSIQISKNVFLTFTGPKSRSEILREIMGSSGVVHLSQIESFSLIAAESRFLNIPLIVAKETPALVNTGGPHAIQVNGNNPISVAKAISRIAQSDYFRNLIHFHMTSDHELRKYKSSSCERHLEVYRGIIRELL